MTGTTSLLDASHRPSFSKFADEEEERLGAFKEKK